MKPKLIIFDNDGVLIDSEIIWHRVNAVEMTRLGFPMTVDKSIKLFTGVTKESFEKIMMHEFGKTLSDNEVIAINQKTEDSYAMDLKAVKNISLVLDYIEQKNINKCVASNGDDDYVMAALKLTHLSQYFKSDHLFTLTKINKRKPAPDIFLHAAKYFNIQPQDCLVIEDHVLGIEAAKAANMPVIGFLGGSHAQNLWSHEKLLKAHPTIIVNDAIELLNILEKMVFCAYNINNQ